MDTPVAHLWRVLGPSRMYSPAHIANVIWYFLPFYFDQVYLVSHQRLGKQTTQIGNTHDVPIDCIYTGLERLMQQQRPTSNAHAGGQACSHLPFQGSSATNHGEWDWGRIWQASCSTFPIGKRERRLLGGLPVAAWRRKKAGKRHDVCGEGNGARW